MRGVRDVDILPLISPLGLPGTSAIRPASTSLVAAASSFSLLGDTSTIVDLSSFGQLLSAVATFQNRLSILRPGATGSSLGSNFGTDFGSLATEVQHFVDSFNGLQGSLNELGFLFGTVPGSSPGTQLTADLQTRLTKVFDNGRSALTRLSDLGIELRPSLIPGVGTLGIDVVKLRGAFETDPAGTFSLLAKAVAEFSALGATFTSSNGGATGLLAAELQFSALQLSQGLFDTGADRLNAGLPGLNDLLTLASLGNAGRDSQARTLAALNEFSLVSSLLGQ
ncbi:hypothetical protein CDA09_16000 [Azoarcus sp. DN11]|nr:hypothetical protein CDA09_16000 [Azoarcus sp. DN11]